MRICYVSCNTGPHTERFLNKMKINHEIHFVSFKEIPLDFYSRHPTLNFYQISLKFPSMSIKTLPNVIRGSFFLRKVIKKIKPDILFGGWIQRDGLICALTNYHPFLLMPWGSDVLINPFTNAFIRLGTSWIIRQADKITCDAEYVKKVILDLAQRNPEDIIVIPWGIEHEIFNSSINGSDLQKRFGWEDKIILIMTRNFESVYNVSTFLSVLPNLCK